MEAIQEERSPLFGRVDLALLLEPFSPDEVALVLPRLSAAEHARLGSRRRHRALSRLVSAVVQWPWFQYVCDVRELERTLDRDGWITDFDWRG